MEPLQMRVSFQLFFKDINNNVITMQDLKSVSTEFYFLRA